MFLLTFTKYRIALVWQKSILYARASVATGSGSVFVLGLLADLAVS